MADASYRETVHADQALYATRQHTLHEAAGTRHVDNSVFTVHEGVRNAFAALDEFCQVCLLHRQLHTGLTLTHAHTLIDTTTTGGLYEREPCPHGSRW